MAIRNPTEWILGQVNGSLHPIDATAPERYWQTTGNVANPSIKRIGLTDIRSALREGFNDFGAYRTDVIFLCIFYPIVGLVLARVAFGYGMLPLLFPLASGFALVGPFAAVGLNEMSRRRELGNSPSWTDVFGVMRSPAFGNIILLGSVLIGLFLFWLVAAQLIYDFTLGPRPPESATQFVHDVFGTKAGWAMIIVGVGVGFVFAAIALCLTLVSFPLLLDRNVSLENAVRISIRSVIENPRTIAVWALVVTGGLILGSIPALLGLAIVLPVLGHATWHLYRRVVEW